MFGHTAVEVFPARDRVQVQAVVMRNAGHRHITQFLVWCRELL